jgi:hypothetical protein
VTLPAHTRVTRRGKTGTVQDYTRGLPHRSLVMWDDDPGMVQFVDDDLLEPVTAEQEVLPL